MRILQEKIIINSEMYRIFDILTRHCNLPLTDPEFLPRAGRMLKIISLLMSENYEKLASIQFKLSDSGQAKKNPKTIECSIALKTAMEIIAEDRDGREYLESLLKQYLKQLNRNIQQLSCSDTHQSIPSVPPFPE